MRCAGGLPLNVAVGASAVMAAAVLGPRKRRGLGMHNLPIAATGALLFCAGYFGITAGSALVTGTSVAASVLTSQV